MIFYQYDHIGGQHVCDLTDLFTGYPAFLVGGAPSLKEQNYNLLEQRGILTFAINNTGCLFRPTCMVSCDHPSCFDPRLLRDPTIIKFSWNAFCSDTINQDSSDKYMHMPNMYMFDVLSRGKDSRMLQFYKDIPWKRNSLFTAICILYHLGIRSVYLAGSDFGTSNGKFYAVGADLDNKERVWNDMLYKSQVRDLIKLKPVFEDFDLKIIDTSKNSKLASVYPTMTIDDAVTECLKNFPSEYLKSYPHVSQLYPGMADKVVSSQYAVVDESTVLGETNERS